MLGKSRGNSKDDLKSLLSQNFKAFHWAIHTFAVIVSSFDNNGLYSKRLIDLENLTIPLK